MVAVASFMLVSCGEDIGGGTGGGSETQTTINLEAGQDLVTSVTTVPLGDSFTVNLVASAGDDALNVLEVFEDGVSITDFGRIMYNDQPAVANPVLLLDDSKTSIDVEIKVEAHTEVGTRTYRFTITDDGGDTESVSVDVTTVGTPPALTINGDATRDFVIGSLNSINLSAVKGSGSIASIGLSIDGILTDITDLVFDGEMFTSNPQALGGDLTEGFTMKSLTLRAPLIEGTYVYTIILTDEFGQESTTDLTANVAPASTPLDVLSGVLFNAGGPVGNGGLDLDNGNTTGSADVEAEIKDQGFAANGSWDQQIAPINGSKLYLLTPGQNMISENFTFASIDSKETLASLNGLGLGVQLSGTVVEGQIYFVERDGSFYAFEVVEVNVTQNDNLDNYVLNIVK